MSSVTFENVTRVFDGSPTPAVHELNLQVGDGEFLVLVGPSGCGKSTALRMVAGLEEVSSGRILIGSEDVTHASPKQRDVAMVFQNYALYPHMTVRENIGFALKMANIAKPERDEKILRAAQLLGLEDLLDRTPKDLSGGQRQRVAMGRAIVRQPQVFLMDEPLSNLDARLRAETRTQIFDLQRRLGVTTLYVTHDQAEALSMGDRVAVMKDGRLQQVASPMELYEHPANTFVAQFIGSPGMNLLPGQVVDSEVRVGSGFQAGVGVFPVRRDVLAQIGGPEVTVGVRPEAWQLVDTESDSQVLQMTVSYVANLGADTYLHCQFEGQTVVVRLSGFKSFEVGQRVGFVCPPDAVYLFDADSGARIARH